MSQKVPIDPKWDHLTQEAVRASNAGMSYGKYKAAEYSKAQALKEVALARAKERAENEDRG